MIKRLFRQEDNSEVKHLSETNNPLKPDSASTDRVVSILRADMVPASEASPARESITHRIDFKRIFGIIIACIILGLLLFLLIGGGRSILEKRLGGLIDDRDMPTSIITHTSVQVLQKTIETLDITTSPTLIPTKIATLKIIASSTPKITVFAPTIKPTLAPIIDTPEIASCRDVSTVSLVDVGQTMCVEGVVKEIIVNPTNYMIIFNTAKGSFYWVTYDIMVSKEEVDHCYQLTGKIDQIANSPILIFDYSNLPEECP